MTSEELPLSRTNAVNLLREHLSSIPDSEKWLTEWHDNPGSFLSTRCLNCLASTACGGFFSGMNSQELDNLVNSLEDYCSHSMDSTAEVAVTADYNPCDLLPNHKNSNN